MVVGLNVIFLRFDCWASFLRSRNSMPRQKSALRSAYKMTFLSGTFFWQQVDKKWQTQSTIWSKTRICLFRKVSHLYFGKEDTWFGAWRITRPRRCLPFLPHPMKVVVIFPQTLFIATLRSLSCFFVTPILFLVTLHTNWLTCCTSWRLLFLIKWYSGIVLLYCVLLMCSKEAFMHIDIWSLLYFCVAAGSNNAPRNA